jgi:hypothetical protein
MRRTEINGRKRQNSSMSGMRTSSLVALSLSFGLVVMAGTARAGDDDRSFTEKVTEGFYGAIRGTNMDNRGIDYRERSPLVVPPTLDLPPPVSAASDAQIANWPKDPDERQRKAVIAAKKKNAPAPSRVQVTAAGVAPQAINIAPPIAPQEAAIPGTTRPTYANDRNGTATTDPVYDKPGDLFTGGAADLADTIGIGNLFGGGKLAPIEPGTEPARQALTQPPAGYQTPSTSYAYGEPKKGLLDGTSNPDRNPLSQMSSASSVAK